ncbi:MAG: hypothetical protein PHS14_10405 [Elusimicrobia bacterium]|nr:hypothetical protein [Elusimicrobiota bacterium]
MKSLSLFLALLTALPPLGRAQEAAAPSTSAFETALSTEPLTEPVTVTAPRIKEQAVLETARAAGAGTAVAGTGLMAYAAFFTAGGPFGWAAALVFLGGMTAYLSHRRLQGKEDFSWSAPPTPPPPQAAKTP